jgi:hypothetical protein
LKTDSWEELFFSVSPSIKNGFVLKAFSRALPKNGEAEVKTPGGAIPSRLLHVVSRSHAVALPW